MTVGERSHAVACANLVVSPELTGNHRYGASTPGETYLSSVKNKPMGSFSMALKLLMVGPWNL